MILPQAVGTDGDKSASWLQHLPGVHDVLNIVCVPKRRIQPLDERITHAANLIGLYKASPSIVTAKFGRNISEEPKSLLFAVQGIPATECCGLPNLELSPRPSCGAAPGSDKVPDRGGDKGDEQASVPMVGELEVHFY